MAVVQSYNLCLRSYWPYPYPIYVYDSIAIKRAYRAAAKKRKRMRLREERNIRLRVIKWKMIITVTEQSGTVKVPKQVRPRKVTDGEVHEAQAVITTSKMRSCKRIEERRQREVRLRAVEARKRDSLGHYSKEERSAIIALRRMLKEKLHLHQCEDVEEQGALGKICGAIGVVLSVITLRKVRLGASQFGQSLENALREVKAVWAKVKKTM